MYASLASLLFIHTYAEFYDISITNNITVLCDNKAYVKKLNEIITNPKYLKYLYKTTEYEVYKFLSTLIPINYKLHHITSHQDDNCSYSDWSLPAKINIQVDKIATHYAYKPINTHLLASPFAIHISNEHTPYNIEHKIRDSSHSSIAKDFLARKCNWTIPTIFRINWVDHSSCIRKLYHSKNIHKTIHTSPPSNGHNTILKPITVSSL